MRPIINTVAFFVSLVMSINLSARELLPWETENVDIHIPGVHAVIIDDRQIFFKVPEEMVAEAGRALELTTRGGKYEDWLKRHGEYQKGCFGMSKNFYTFGIPLLGIDAQFSIRAKLHVKTSPENRAFRGKHNFDPKLGYLPIDSDRGDFTKPKELFENLKRMRYLNDGYTTPMEEVVINDRKWYRYMSNSSLYPDDLHEYYVTGLASDRYLEVQIRLYPVPVYSDRFPRYAPEDQQPRWMKKSIKYKEQVISSLRITKPEGSKEPDLYEVPSVKSPIANQ